VLEIMKRSTPLGLAVSVGLIAFAAWLVIRAAA